MSNWLEKVLFSYIIHSNFRASVPWCINTCKSEFSAENSDENRPTCGRVRPSLGRVDSVGNDLTRASVNTGISKFSVENSDEKKPLLWEGTIYLGPSLLGRVCIDQHS